MFNTIWVIGFGQAESLSHALHMRVNDNAGLAEGISQNDIRGLSSNSRQSDQLLHRLRNLFVELFRHGLATGNEMFGLILIEASRPNELFELCQIGSCQICRSRIAEKEWRGHLIDPLVGTLSGENRGHKQLPGGTMVELHLRGWHGELECLANGPEAFLTIERW